MKRFQRSLSRPVGFVALSVLLLGMLAACQDPATEGGLPLPPLGPPPRPDLDLALGDALMRARVTTVSQTLSSDSGNESMVALGRALFFDPILSGDRNISCATCHHPSAGTSDALPVSIGAGGSGSRAARDVAAGAFVARNAPSVYNLGAVGSVALFWDGRVSRNESTGVLTTPEAGLNGSTPTLAAIAAQLTTATAAQALFPIVSDEEMRGNSGNEIRDAPDNASAWAAVMVRLVGSSNGTVGGIAGYRSLFTAAFPGTANFDEFNIGHAGRAIAAFESAVFRSDASAGLSAFDRYLTGERAALSVAEKRGALTFFGRRGGCARCHNGPALSDFAFHSIAAPQVGPGAGGEASEDRGRALVSGNTADNYQFRTPPLRNVELSAPYTHSGAYSTLEAVVNHYSNPAAALLGYDASQLGRADLIGTADTDATRNQARINALSVELRRPGNFSPGEAAEIVAFLKTLTDPGARSGNNAEVLATVSGLPLAH